MLLEQELAIRQPQDERLASALDERTAAAYIKMTETLEASENSLLNQGKDFIARQEAVAAARTTNPKLLENVQKDNKVRYDLLKTYETTFKASEENYKQAFEKSRAAYNEQADLVEAKQEAISKRFGDEQNQQMLLKVREHSIITSTFPLPRPTPQFQRSLGAIE
jgi:hypothetical protein